VKIAKYKPTKLVHKTSHRSPQSLQQREEHKRLNDSTLDLVAIHSMGYRGNGRTLDLDRHTLNDNTHVKEPIICSTSEQHDV